MICVNPKEELVQELSIIMYNWWGMDEGWSMEKIYQYVKHSCLDNCLPMTFVHFEDEKLAGFCQLTYQDVDVRPDLYPWFINMYVKEEYRGKGICRMLVEEALDKAKELGFSNVYLYAIINGLYERFGFKRVSDLQTYDNDIKYGLYKKSF